MVFFLNDFIVYENNRKNKTKMLGADIPDTQMLVVGQESKYPIPGTGLSRG